ncbi:hypothetical protein AVEN_173581-1 [Araneus ventricosus]|uniref:Uncharacterized protein n=1 Tax=Araneus ventricosus TaxID=182803 RepID=A0A4Y2CRR1_ARAVE|nr:hypothetical protein AVEN_173581-1 [Araneus ventricosus]
MRNCRISKQGLASLMGIRMMWGRVTSALMTGRSSVSGIVARATRNGGYNAEAGSFRLPRTPRLVGVALCRYRVPIDVSELPKYGFPPKFDRNSHFWCQDHIPNSIPLACCV